MHEGSDVLFRVSLAILQATEAALLQAMSLPDCYEILRTPCESTLTEEDLFERMYGTWLDGWTSSQLVELRKVHLPVVQEEDNVASARRAARMKAQHESAAAASVAAGEQPPSQAASKAEMD